MDITPFIRELLFGHDCVIVPGFGGLIGNYTPARIDRNSSTFYPPVKQISFNRNLNHNDGLLVGRISESLKVNYGDSREIVEEFVSGVRRKLEKGEKVVFDNIGSFINNQEGNIQFEPADNVNYHIDSYGLESFQFIPLEGYDVRQRITRHIDKEPVRHSSLKRVLWRTAVIIPLLVVLAIIPFKSKVESTTMNPLATVELENNKNAVEGNIPPSETRNEKLPAPESGNPEITETTPVSNKVEQVIPDNEVYLLITGSFKSEQNAVAFSDRLKKDGYSSEVLAASNGFYRVSAMRCNDLETAIKMKSSMAVKFPGIWYKKVR